MSKKIFLSLLFASSLLSISCKKELEPQESFSTTGTPKTEADTKTASANVTPVQPNTVVTPNTAATAAPGMNPAHGQPGHRCDVAVGAPLNSTVGKTTSAQTITPTSQTANAVVQSTPTKVAPGMNPAHGQPGHRCDIKVGEPLNSPASKAVASTPTGTSGTVSMPINVSASEANQKNPSGSATPAILNPTATTTAPGMNPPHGQPGHVCSVAVGAPLPK